MKSRTTLFTHWWEPFATHQPVLYEVAKRCKGPIVEFGCGEGSTRLLHAISESRGVPLLTLDSDHEWLLRYQAELESPLHRFRLVEDWAEELTSPQWDEQLWGLAFIDQSPWEARAVTARRMKDNADYVILHDCDYFAESGLLGTSIRPLLGARERGERRYDDVFRWWQEFFPLEPWPYEPTGPPTLLASNVHDVRALQIDYAQYAPPPWRQAVTRFTNKVIQRLRR